MNAEEVYSIESQTVVGPVALSVADLSRSQAFYEGVLGLQILNRGSETMSLGATPGKPLILLTEIPGARIARRTTGLYHLALLYPSRSDLARAVIRLVQTRWPIQGAADHLVSEAVYLADPDGNGIELYRDRPKDQWPHSNGHLEMANAPFNLQALVDEQSEDGDRLFDAPPDTRMGHVHLNVRDVRETEAFYHGVLGFEIMLNWGEDAVFLSAGGYHHHIGGNTWSGIGNSPAPEGSAGLRYFTILLPTEKALKEAVNRLKTSGVSVIQTEGGFLTHDPSHIGILLTAVS